MKAAIVEQPGVLTVRELSAPFVGEYEVLCRSRYGSICTGTDSHIVGQHKPFSDWVPLPLILGHETVGEVVECGLRVRSFRPGDLVTRVGHPGTNAARSMWGGFAEQTVGIDWMAMRDDGVDPSQWRGRTMQRRLPPGVDAATGTMFITWRETLSYSKRVGVQGGSRVLVVGSGSNGLAIANHAANLGAATVVMIGSPSREAHATRAGCAGFVDYRSDNAKDRAIQFSPSGFDVAIDAIGTNKTANLALQCLCPGGTLGIYGMDAAGSIALEHGRMRGTVTVYGGAYDEGETHDEVCSLLDRGVLDASIWIDAGSAFELDRIGEAFEAVKSRSLVKPLIRLG